MKDHQRAEEGCEHTVDESFTLGFSVHDTGSDDSNAVIDVIPGSPAANVGIAPGMHLVAVNGRRWSPDILRTAIRAAKNSKEPIELLLENDDYFRVFSLDYHGGSRSPPLTGTAPAELF